MDSDLAWVNGKSGRQSWRYGDAFQRSIISEAIYFTIFLMLDGSLDVILTLQVVGNRMYTGSTDGSLRIWTLKGLKATDIAKQPTDTETTGDADAADDDDVARQRKAAEQ